MKVLIIGNGAKELALMQHLMEKGGHDALVVPGNPGGHRFAQSIGSDLSALDTDDILKTAENFKPDYIIVIDELFVKNPVTAKLKEKGFNVIAPNMDAADVLYRKAKWTEYFDEHNLACPDHIIADDYDHAYTAIQESEGPWVLTKLSDPSEFTVCYLEEEATDILSSWFAQSPCKVMISEYIDAPRFYLSSLINGSDVYPLQTSVIQRGIYEQEDDAETKGMGAFCPADNIDPSLTQAAVDEILKPFFTSLAQEGKPYTGWMAGEFVVDDENHPICVNLKCGLSDCASVLTFTRMQSDVMEAVENLVNHKPVEISWSPKSAASIVLAASTYPKAPSEGKLIEKDEDFEGLFYPHRTRIENGRLVTNGGRVAIVAAEGVNRQEAVENALHSASQVHCEDLFYRTDIGKING